MIPFLRVLFTIVIVSMLAVTTWASLHTSLFAIPREVLQHPWFIATLFDAYWAFIAFYVWLAWKERGALARVLWFVAVIGLGNIAMAVYFLRELFRIPASGPLDPVFVRRNVGGAILPAVLAVLTIAVYEFA